MPSEAKKPAGLGNGCKGVFQAEDVDCSVSVLH